MPKPDFETIWVPRIGERGAAEFRRYQLSLGIACAAMLVFAGAAGLAFGGGGLDKQLLGVLFAVGAVGGLVGFRRSQNRFAAVLSQWFGVKIAAGQLPLMSPGRFDAWCEKRGLRSPNGPISEQHPGATS
jgi:hypothetical protein